MIDIGEMHIDLSTKCVSIHDRLIPITKKEFEILNMLAQSPGKIFSREDILNKVWSDDSYVLERTVDVHITRLRKTGRTRENISQIVPGTAIGAWNFKR